MAVTQQEAVTQKDVANQRDTDGIVLTPEQQKSRRNRNVAIGLAVGFFVLLFYVVTIAKLGSHVLDRQF